LTANSGGEVFPSGGTIFVVGDGTTITAVGNPGTSTITLSAIASDATSFTTDSGTATPVAGVLDIHGGSNINTAGATNVVTVNLDTTLTGLTSVTTNNLTVNTTATLPTITNLTVGNLTVTTSETFSNLGQGVVQSSSAGVISSSEGTDGQLLISSSTGAPVWANLVAGSNVTIINGHNSISIASTGGGGSTAGSVLLASQDMTGLSSYTFSGISSSYSTYQIVADTLQFTTGTAGEMLISYAPSNYNNCTGCIIYYPYNSATATNLNNSASGFNYIAPYFSSANPQYVSFNMYLYNLPGSSASFGFGKPISGQGTLYTSTSVYQFVESSFAGSTSGGTIPAVTSFTFICPTITSGTLEVYGLSN
jgi:hypothetical protein